MKHLKIEKKKKMNLNRQEMMNKMKIMKLFILMMMSEILFIIQTKSFS